MDALAAVREMFAMFEDEDQYDFNMLTKMGPEAKM